MTVVILMMMPKFVAVTWVVRFLLFNFCPQVAVVVKLERGERRHRQMRQRRRLCHYWRPQKEDQSWNWVRWVYASG